MPATSGGDATNSFHRDPVMAATLEHVEKLALRTRRAGSTGSRASSPGSIAPKHKEAEESILPYVPKAYELYVLTALPLIPFVLLLLFLAPLLMDE